jgi:predicted amidophosphoribosyltransferase
MTQSVTTANAKNFLREICIQTGQKIRQRHGSGVVIVPVPNSDGLVSSGKDFRTYIMAKVIAGVAGCTASDVLRWKSALGKAHKGERPRDADAHKNALKVMRQIDKPIVLFDDVVTSGSQLYGAKLALEECGMTVVGMYAVAEVVNNGERSDSPGWRITTRNPFSLGDVMGRLNF